MMKPVLTVVVVAAMGASLMARADTTVSGEVIDLNCHLRKTTASPVSEDLCGVENAKRGQPLAILAGDGTLYIIKGDWTKNKNEKLIEWVQKRVDATGEVTDVNGKKMLKLADLKAGR
ncbi:MAG: hypothetical protein AB7I50_09835 [Vicinamibacterales bacterium]